MNTFGQGFKLGLIGGLYNHMFSGCGMFNGFGRFNNCGMFGFNNYFMNPFCNYSFSPMFYPTMNTFTPIIPYQPQMDFLTFTMGQQGWNSKTIWDITPKIEEKPKKENKPQKEDNKLSKVSNQHQSTKFTFSVSQPIQQVVTESDEKRKETQASTESGGKRKESEVSNESKLKEEQQKNKVKIEDKYTVEKLKRKWKKKKPNLNLSDEFYQKVINISKNINCDPNDLMGIMNLETRGTFSPSEKNPSTGATGLIQFMDAAASDLGTTREKLSKMSALEQLDYVERYFQMEIKRRKVKGKIDAGTLYTLVFYPAWAKKGLNETIASKGSDVYDKNRGLDANKDGRITKADLSRKMEEFIA